MAQSLINYLAQTTPVNRAVFFLSATVMMIGILLLPVVGPEKTYLIVENVQFLLSFLGLGLIVAVIVIVFLRYYLAEVFKDQFLKRAVYVFLMIGIVLTVVETAAYYNYKDAPTLYYKNFKIIRKNIIKQKGSLIFEVALSYRQISKNINVIPATFDSLKVGSFVKVKIKHGKLNYDFLDFDPGIVK